MILDDFRLDGKVAVVTGASRGLGQAIAVGLAEAGASVAGVARSEQTATAGAVEKVGRRFLAVGADLADRESRETVIEETLAEFGRIDILVNAAGITHREPAVEFPLREWDRILEVNLTAVFELCQLAARRMLTQGSGGKIVNVASLGSFQGGMYIPAYIAAKSGLAGLTRALSNEWGKLGINVNAIAPGYFRTDMTAPLAADPVRAPEILSRIPVGRWGEPREIAGAAVFLASGASTYCHGTILVVDGGWLAK